MAEGVIRCDPGWGELVKEVLSGLKYLFITNEPGWKILVHLRTVLIRYGQVIVI